MHQKFRPNTWYSMCGSVVMFFNTAICRLLFLMTSYYLFCTVPASKSFSVETIVPTRNIFIVNRNQFDPLRCSANLVNFVISSNVNMLMLMMRRRLQQCLINNILFSSKIKKLNHFYFLCIL